MEIDLQADISIFNYIRNCQEENLLIDVIIHVDNTPFPAHRIMMAKYSTYFQEQFCTPQHGCKLPINMSFSGMSTASFSAILQFIYNGYLTINFAHRNMDVNCQ
jgi:hypothetical protein